MDEDEWEVRRLWYAGRFHAQGNKLYHSFIDEATEANHMFSKAPRWATIGALYEVEFKTGSNRARIESGTMIEDHDLHVDYLQWRLDDQAHALAKQHQDALKRMQSHNSEIGKLTLAEILTMMQGQP